MKGFDSLSYDWIEVRARAAHLKNEAINQVDGSDLKFKVKKMTLPDGSNYECEWKDAKKTWSRGIHFQFYGS